MTFLGALPPGRSFKTVNAYENRNRWLRRSSSLWGALLLLLPACQGEPETGGPSGGPGPSQETGGSGQLPSTPDGTGGTGGSGDACGNACGEGLFCSQGSCVSSCAPGEEACGQSCVATQGNDPNNCGACGNVCTGGRVCVTGACECDAGRTWDGTSCACPDGTSWTGASCEEGATTGIFDECRFHFGTIDSYARDNPSIRDQIDFFTPGWMGFSTTFDQQYVCDDTAPGGPLEGKVPVVVAYVAAFYSKLQFGRCDCNVHTCGEVNGRANDLCNFGAADIRQNLNTIVNIYRSYAEGYRDCYGTSRPIIFAMEPDWYQYTYNDQTAPLSTAEAASFMKQFVDAIREHLPNAAFSMDISPWVAPNNGMDHGAQWYGHFDMSQFTFINTSGGSTEAANSRIRQENNMTWAGVSQATGKPILADTGYGANGVSAGHDANWDNPAYINARMKDGVVSISQYNPNSNWGSTLSALRGQLDTPKFCP
ncbi:MAG: hypothetical protein GX607_17225 [Myxococcales bacterium]|nr:hypothetical protein [Myxococcales bacterium]